MSISLNNIKYSLQNTENYRNSIQSTSAEIIEKYGILIIEYLKFIIENTNIKDKSYFKFVLIRGMETISHVFNNLLYFTKNLDVSYYNSQKALYYYVEFIGQIFDAQHSFLKFSSRDAVIYVYKKTLFELNNERKKTMVGLNDEDKSKHNILCIYNKLYKNIIHSILNNNEFLLQNKKESIQDIFNKFETTTELFNAYSSDIVKIQTIHEFVQAIQNQTLDAYTYIHILSAFAKKIHKKTFSKNKLSELEGKINLSPDAFVEWLFM